MSNLITVKVDVTKIDKSRLFAAQSGAKYLDLVLIPMREPGKYGDTHLVKQSKKKDEDVDLPIIGNATERGSAPAPSNYEARPQPPIEDEDVPF